MVFRTLAIALATVSTIISNVNGGIPGLNSLPGPKEKSRIDMIKIDGTPNEYFTYAHIESDPERFSSTTDVTIAKTLPEDLTVKIALNLHGQDIPPIEFPVCPGMHDKIFVDDVVSKGKPKETFPRSCPIQPGNYTVEHWEYPHYKIPPGTPPGPLLVNVWLLTKGESIFHLYSEGEIVITDVPTVPVGK